MKAGIFVKASAPVRGTPVIGILDAAAVSLGDGRPLPHVFSYWFAWQAFHPGTRVYRPAAQ